MSNKKIQNHAETQKKIVEKNYIDEVSGKSISNAESDSDLSDPD